MSKITQRNWWIDAALFGSALIAALSGLYYLYFPTGGYQGGRNPYYNMQVIFSRHTWDDLHTWGGIAMISIALLHITLHWSWFVNMTRRMLRDLTGKTGKMNLRSRLNLILNIVVGLSFLLAAISGVYFLFSPGGRGTVDSKFLFSRITWDMIHTWAGVTLITAGVIHFTIHWLLEEALRAIAAALQHIQPNEVHINPPLVLRSRHGYSPRMKTGFCELALSKMMSPASSILQLELSI